MSKYFVIAAIGALAFLLVAVILIFIPSFEQFDLNSSVYTYSNKYSKINSDIVLDSTESGLTPTEVENGTVSQTQTKGSFSGDNLTYGSWIQIPDEMVNKRFFTYTDYSRYVTESMGSKQGAAKIYWKKNNMIEHDEHNNCYIKYNNVNYLCVALPSRVCCADGTEFYESNGHTFLAKCADGEIIPMVMVDAKGDSDTVANDHWGQRGPQQCCYIESYVWGSVPDNPNNNPYSPLHKDGEFNNLKKVVAICKGPDIGGS